MKLKKIVKATDIKNPLGLSLRVAKMPENIDLLFDKSKGIDKNDLKAIAGKFVLLARVDSEGEYRYTLAGQFEQGDGTFAEGTFNASGLHRITAVNSFYSDTLCTTCGRQNVIPEHKCTNPLCRCCGKELTYKVADNVCDECATDFATKEYGYHDHPTRTLYEEPAFDRPHLRTKYAHLGLEIEVNSLTCQSKKLAKKLGEIINEDIHHRRAKFEHDGSIDNGTECILEPTTFKTLNNCAIMFDKFYKTANDINGEWWGHGNGLHIHIDRTYYEGGDGLGAVAIAMLIYKYYDFFKMISGRRSDNFYYAQGLDGDKTLNSVCKKVFDTYRHDHRDSVNCSNRETIEIRIFGGHIDTASKMLAVCDIVNALARWSKETALQNVAKAHPADIVRYINDPANVLAFVTHRNGEAFTSPDAEAVLAQFTAKLAQKINN